MYKVILDTDPGVDDTMAIAYALCHPEIQLLALTTVFGNTSVEFATRNAQYVLDCFGAVEVAVAKGAAIPSVQSPLPYADYVHGHDGLGTVYPLQPEALNPDAAYANVSKLDAADFMIDAARKAPGEITLIAVGPLTNIALALAREPKLPSLIRALVIMGGTVDEPGNVSPLAEANFLNDPHAADAVFAADWPATVVGLDVTHRIMIGDSHLARLRDKAGATGDLIWRSSRFYIDFYTQKGAAADATENGSEPACAMHDAAAIAAVVIPDAFTTVAGPARVVAEGMATGQFAIDRAGYQYAMPHWQGRPDTLACMAVDAVRVRDDFLNTLVTHRRV